MNDLGKFIGSLDFKKTSSLKHLKIVVFGTGVIGGSVGGWIAQNYDNIYFLDLPDMAKKLKENGLTLYPQDNKDAAEQVDIKVIESLDEALDADIILLGVKNYSLENVAKFIREKVGDRPIIVGMQNGLENQTILPKYFSKVIYCIVSYNAWMDDPGVIGYQKKGPLHLGTRYNELQEEMELIGRIFNLGVETEVNTNIGDAAHSKLILNLTNSLTTLIGLSFKPISDQAIFQKLLTNLLSEGVEIVKAAGYKESKLGGMPPWFKLQAGARLPRFITKGMFDRNAKKMVISSMGQDIIQRGGSDSELESINGYVLKLAEKHGTPAPYNRTVYELCKREFSGGKFTPMDVKDVWAEVEKAL